MGEENKNDVVTGASETIDASSGSSMLEHEEPKKKKPLVHGLVQRV